MTTMQIFVKCLATGHTTSLTVEPQALVLQVKQQLASMTPGITVASLVLTYKQSVLGNAYTLLDYQVTKESTLFVLVRRCDCGKCLFCRGTSTRPLASPKP